MVRVLGQFIKICKHFYLWLLGRGLRRLSLKVNSVVRFWKQESELEVLQRHRCYPMFVYWHLCVTTHAEKWNCVSFWRQVRTRLTRRFWIDGAGEVEERSGGELVRNSLVECCCSSLICDGRRTKSSCRRERQGYLLYWEESLCGGGGVDGALLLLLPGW